MAKTLYLVRGKAGISFQVFPTPRALHLNSYDASLVEKKVGLKKNSYSPFCFFLYPCEDYLHRDLNFNTLEL